MNKTWKEVKTNNIIKQWFFLFIYKQINLLKSYEKKEFHNDNDEILRMKTEEQKMLESINLIEQNVKTEILLFQKNL